MLELVFTYDHRPGERLFLAEIKDRGHADHSIFGHIAVLKNMILLGFA